MQFCMEMSFLRRANGRIIAHAFDHAFMDGDCLAKGMYGVRAVNNHWPHSATDVTGKVPFWGLLYPSVSG